MAGAFGSLDAIWQQKRISLDVADQVLDPFLSYKSPTNKKIIEDKLKNVPKLRIR